MSSFKPFLGFGQEKYCSEECYGEAGRSLFRLACRQAEARWQAYLGQNQGNSVSCR